MTRITTFHFRESVVDNICAQYYSSSDAFGYCNVSISICTTFECIFLRYTCFKFIVAYFEHIK